MSLPLTLFLVWLVANALILALLLSQARGLVMAAGWLFVAVGMVVIVGPVMLIAMVVSWARVRVVSDAR